MAKPKCPECNSSDTKKARQVVDEGNFSSSTRGVGLGTGGLGVFAASGSSKSRLAEKAEEQEDDGGFLIKLIATAGYILVFALSIGVWVLLNERLEWIAATISALVFFGLGSWLVSYIAAVLTMLVMLGLAIWLSVYVADVYSWWVGAPVGFIAVGTAFFMAADSIKNFLADIRGDNYAKYKKTWMCMSCGNRFIEQ